ncbi:hypothetical protein BGZ94_010067 [Podila epigama]|nr:hypothetical protein BGZ94_010067 [Podila epigama]
MNGNTEDCVRACQRDHKMDLIVPKQHSESATIAPIAFRPEETGAFVMILQVPKFYSQGGGNSTATIEVL